MAEIGWPAEHPTDKRPCVVCKARPVLMLESSAPDVGHCYRCGTPYVFRDDSGKVTDRLYPQFQGNILEIAIDAWKSYGRKISIEWAPFVRVGWPTLTEKTLTPEAAKLGRQVGDPVVTDFEWFVAGCKETDTPQ
ncbi:MAG: hypothetical protein GY778_04890, partial [bacterium]|nr:hypothetical protein [bacterium]